MKSRILLTFLLLISVIIVYAQSKEEKQLFQKAKELYDAGKYEQAIPNFEKLNDLAPANFSYYFRLSVCYLLTGKDKVKALELLERAEKERPEVAEVNLYLIKAYTDHLRFNEAQLQYEKLLESPDVDLYVELANDYLNQTHLAEEIHKPVEEVIKDVQLADVPVKTSPTSDEAIHKNTSGNDVQLDIAITQEKPNEKLQVREMPQKLNVKEVKGKLAIKGDLVEKIKEAEAAPVTKKQLSVPNAYFGYDSQYLTPQTAQNLRELLKTMKEFKSLKIEITGHTDSKGAEDYNMKLGLRRANSVAAYLIRNGIAANRITTKSMGEEQPIAPNENADGSDNPEGRSINRRVEIFITNPLPELEITYPDKGAKKLVIS
jgi:outer membrane protein OmpA-like peptidoglycan-associated protein